MLRRLSSPKTFAGSILFTLIVLIGIFLVSPARAEGNCPSGSYPIGGGEGGWVGCAPMFSGSGYGGASIGSPRAAPIKRVPAELVFQDANGHWILYGAGSPDGRNCMVAYTSQKDTLILAGPDSRRLSGIIFVSPSIPADDTQRQTIIDLHSDADPGGVPTRNVPVMVMKTGTQRDADRMVATSIGNMAGFLKGLREIKSIWLTEGESTLYRVDNIGGIFQARDALARCMKLPPIKARR